MKGLVSLVGAGPGDPGLLTLKARKRLAGADLVIYDYLANPEHLKHCRPDARRVCVGRDFRHSSARQRSIHSIILRAARKGQRVVRLKGGDPYLFGRGGEEAEFLRAHRVAFEAVPGVTSASACAAYAGIALTHRETNASVTFLTGHRAGDPRLDSIDWRALVRLKGTIAVYMGVTNVAVIARRLIGAGMEPGTPAAVVEWGTLPRQRSVSAPLSRIAGACEAQGLEAPAMIYIGSAVARRERLDWFERLPLFGKSVVVTRMGDRSQALADRLSELGAEVLSFPVIGIKPVKDPRALDAAIRAVHDNDWAVFTSVPGVEAVFARLKALGLDTRYLAGVRIACVGSETAAALAERGVRADLVPRRFETAELAKALKAAGVRGKRVALFRTDIAPPELERGLRSAGAIVGRVTAYRTTLPADVPAQTLARLRRGRADILTFTSASCVENFARIVGRAGMRRLSSRARAASIGPVTTRAAKRRGMRVRCEAKPYTIEGLAEAIRRRA